MVLCFRLKINGLSEANWRRSCNYNICGHNDGLFLLICKFPGENKCLEYASLEERMSHQATFQWRQQLSQIIYIFGRQILRICLCFSQGLLLVLLDQDYQANTPPHVRTHLQYKRARQWARFGMARGVLENRDFETKLWREKLKLWY